MNDTPAQTSHRRSLAAYRVMAIITGVFLLLVFVDMAIKYGGEWLFDWRNETFIAFSSLIAVIHGWIYIVYLVTVVNLWFRFRWGIGRLAYMVLGGVIPLLSFYAERRITREVTASLSP